jgi:hypothetical protein
MQKSDKGKKKPTWPKEDCIRWAEWRLNEWASIEVRKRPREFADGLPAKLDLYVYLAKERDRLSARTDRAGDCAFREGLLGTMVGWSNRRCFPMHSRSFQEIHSEEVK